MATSKWTSLSSEERIVLAAGLKMLGEAWVTAHFGPKTVFGQPNPVRKAWDNNIVGVAAHNVVTKMNTMYAAVANTPVGRAVQTRFNMLADAARQTIANTAAAAKAGGEAIQKGIQTGRETIQKGIQTGRETAQRGIQTGREILLPDGTLLTTSNGGRGAPAPGNGASGKGGGGGAAPPDAAADITTTAEEMIAEEGGGLPWKKIVGIGALLGVGLYVVRRWRRA